MKDMQEARPFFSVIMTTYNRADLLRIALKSLAAQTFRDYEAFIVDDASADGTAKVFEEFSGMKNWNFIRLTENRGYPYAKNLVFRKCRGKFITFLDSDDVWLPGRLQRFFDKYVENPAAGFIFSDGYILSRGGIRSRMFDAVRGEVPKGRLPGYYAVSNMYLPYVTTNVAFLAEAVGKIGYYREDMRLLGDTEYFVRLVENYEVDYIVEPLSIYRIHDSGGSQITRRWEDCIKESFISLDVYPPPKDVYRKFSDFIYLQQGSAMAKNGCGRDARRCLAMATVSPRLAALYLLTFLPAAFARLAGGAAGLLRDLRQKAVPVEGHCAAIEYLEKLGRDTAARDGKR